MMEISPTIKETQKGLLAKKYTVVDLVDSYLERINRLNPKLNALLTISDDLAYQQARKCDAVIKTYGNKALENFPLLGVVVAHKDLFLTKGIRTTAGSKVLDNYIPVYSATVVEKLEEAGCIMIGKANCDAWAHGASGENSDFGPAQNPWNTGYVPGGSSSGSACTIASGLSLISTGTDTGGSVRQPANFCGIVGLKPTYGSVSRYGIIAMASSLDSIGHFTWTVEDSEKVFQITKGGDGKDGTLKNDQLSVTRDRLKNRKIKIGIPKEYFIEGLDREVEKAVLAAAAVFKQKRVELVDVSLPHTKYAISVYYIVQPAEVSSNLARYDGIRYGQTREFFGDEAKRRIMLGTYVLSEGYYEAYYLQAMKVRSKIIQDFEQAFERVDAIIAPVSPTPPFKIGEKAQDPLKMYLADILTVAGNLAGIPGLSIPTGFNKNNLPLGFQLLGPRFSEEILFRLGKTYQQEINWQPKIATP